MNDTQHTAQTDRTGIRQIVRRFVGGKHVGDRVVEHGRHRVTRPLTAAQREANYRAQNGRRSLTVNQRRQVRRAARREQAAS